MSRSKPRVDFTWANHGSVWLLQPTTRVASQHLRTVLESPEVQWWAGAVVVEPRYVASLTAALQEDGFAF
jgi:hypothetical protein